MGVYCGEVFVEESTVLVPRVRCLLKFPGCNGIGDESGEYYKLSRKLA